MSTMTTTEDLMIVDIFAHIFSFLADDELSPLITTNRFFSKLVLPRWRSLVSGSFILQRQRRQYYHRRSTTLSIAYDSAEKAHSRKFLGFNSRLGVSAYTYTTAGLNIFVRVRPCAMGHEVGAVCTWNGWRSEGISRGWWVKNLPDNEEIWRINIGYNEFCEDLWFSVYVRDSAGREAWDSNDGWNYTLNLLVLNTTTYDTSHPAVLQYEQNKNNGNHFDEDNAEVCEEQWLNVNHVSCC